MGKKGGGKGGDMGSIAENHRKVNVVYVCVNEVTTSKEEEEVSVGVGVCGCAVVR